MTSIINIKKANLVKLGYKDLEDWISYPDHIYIGRNMDMYVKGSTQSKWYNPFTVKKHGRSGCLKMYREYIESNQELLDQLSELEGKTLGCWCAPEACHGDILIELINGNKNM